MLTTHRIAALAAAILLIGTSAASAQHSGLGGAVELIDPEYLRVCADPDNLPFSDDKGAGFENKLAELVASKLGKKVSYHYFPQVTGFVRNTLAANRCDVIMNYPQGDELVQNTNAYYRTAYALVYRGGGELDGIETIEDAKLQGKRVGVVAGTPPATNLAKAGLIGKAKPYQLFVDTRIDSTFEQMIKDVEDGVTDAAVVWGPVAGYYAARANPPLEVVPLTAEKVGSRMVYRMTMGVRAADQNWKRQLNDLIRENQGEINKILLEYSVPILDEKDQRITQ
ncbi:substrate-binding domain-containing protein [Faunimonas sp. B44]|uniref:substrate-binding domain-containing protein n=1 Tax=Faunimonas sp. B44 TaxID=3461493 RepID=UPI004044E340